MTQSDDGLVSESIIFGPIAELNNPVTVSIPIRDIEGLEGLEYVLQPGNIPLTPDGNGNLAANITTGPSTSGPVAEATFLGELREFAFYFITTQNIRIDETDDFSDEITLTGGCGESLDVPYPIPGVPIPAAVSNYIVLLDFRADRNVRVQLDESEENRRVTVQARHRTRTYTIIQNESTISSVTVNRAVVETSDPTLIACHDSGTNQ